MTPELVEQLGLKQHSRGRGRLQQSLRRLSLKQLSDLSEPLTQPGANQKKKKKKKKRSTVKPWHHGSSCLIADSAVLCA